MFRLIRIGGVIIGSSTLLGILNGKFNQPRPSIPKFDQKVFEEKIKQMNEQSLNTPRLSFPTTNRNENIKDLTTNQFDVLVIGGGATGAGVLLNLYNKGLKCALIESRDFASGTSSKSTKLAHGGIRYLEEVFQFKKDSYQKYKLVTEALIERDFFANSAPHLNNIVEIKIPLAGSFKFIYYFSGVLLYHFLYFMKSLPNIFYVFPGPKIYLNHSDNSSHQTNNNYSLSNNFKYFVSLHECQMFDSRQNILSLLTTTIDQYIEGSSPSVIANYTEFKEFLYDNNKQIVGVKAFDKINNKMIEIKAKTVINCAGFNADNLFNKEDPQYNKLISTSKGSKLYFI